MKRYQVYLNPRSVSILDDFQNYTNIKRSQLIRETIDRLAQNLIKVLVTKNELPQEKLILDSLIGSIKVGDHKPTNYALRNDSAYLMD